MPDTITVTVEDTIEAVAALRAELKNNYPDKGKIEKIDAFLNTQEELNQKNLAAVQEQKARADEFKTRLHDMELELARSTPAQEKDYRESVEFKAMQEMIIHGDLKMPDDLKANLQTDIQTQGGYLAQSELDNAITKLITEVSDIRSIARVRNIGSKSLEVPVRKTIPAAKYEGEAEAGGESNSTYGKEILTPFRQTFTTPVTMDMLMDSAFSMDGEILSDAAEAFAKGEGQGFVSGTGFKQPEGFLVNADILANLRTSSTSGTIEPEDIINLTGDLKVGYDPVYVFSRATLAFIRTLTSTTGQFLWQPGLNGPVSNTLNGFPYLVANDMPDIASDSLSIAFGDFRRGYTIIDRTGLSIVRDEFTKKTQAIIEITMNRWNTGQVTLPEAIKVMQTAT
jgi:HK97 family phage major capsid protein